MRSEFAFSFCCGLKVKHLSLRCRERDTPVGHRQDKVENTVDLVGMSGCHNFAA